MTSYSNNILIPTTDITTVIETETWDSYHDGNRYNATVICPRPSQSQLFRSRISPAYYGYYHHIRAIAATATITILLPQFLFLLHKYCYTHIAFIWSVFLVPHHYKYYHQIVLPHTTMSPTTPSSACHSLLLVFQQYQSSILSAVSFKLWTTFDFVWSQHHTCCPLSYLIAHYITAQVIPQASTTDVATAPIYIEIHCSHSYNSTVTCPRPSQIFQIQDNFLLPY